MQRRRPLTAALLPVVALAALLGAGLLGPAATTGAVDATQRTDRSAVPVPDLPGVPVATVTAPIAAPKRDKRLVRLINAARRDRGLRPVRVVAALTHAAALRSMVNATTTALVHDPALGATASKAGCRWTRVGENIAVQPATAGAKAIFNAYRRSAPHWAIILDRGFRQVGSATLVAGAQAWNTVKFANGC
ncbi:MAG: CAP domain-containing protein [Actinomycetota bacterium]|nr:MAG: CAP domain-containing protein [Actinomycetota bacterium]